MQVTSESRFHFIGQPPHGELQKNAVCDGGVECALHCDAFFPPAAARSCIEQFHNNFVTHNCSKAIIPGAATFGPTTRCSSFNEALV